MHQHTRKIAVAFAASALTLLAASGCASLDQWQRRAIFQHETAARVDARWVPDGAQEFDLALPGGGVSGADRVRFWYLPAGAADAPTVLYLHGARHNLNGNAHRIERLHALGFNVLAPEYRGFGQSTPILPSEQSAIEDAQLAFAELQRREPDAARRIVYGYSLGGAVAIALAQQADGIAGVVVESTFTSIPDVVRTMRWGWVPFIGVAVTQRFDSLARIAQVDEPLLFIHGTADGIVPHTMSDRLYEAARRVPPERKRVVKVNGATHRGAMSLDPGAYGRALTEFVQSVVYRAPGGTAAAGAAAAALPHPARN